MVASAARSSRTRLIVASLMFATWVVLAALLAAQGASVELLLKNHFAALARRDAFGGLDRIFWVSWLLFSAAILLMTTAVFRGRIDVAVAVVLGPLLAGTAVSATQNWSDPDVFTVVGVTSIGCLVGAVVGGLWWAVKAVAGTR